MVDWYYHLVRGVVFGRVTKGGEMNKSRTLWLFGFALICFLVAGCRIRIVVPEGGKVISESGSYECLSGEVCKIDVSDIYFNETFVAVPDPHYTFIGWKQKEKALCGGSEEPCHLITTEFLGNEVLMAFLESNEAFSLIPQFKPPTDADLWVGMYDYGYFFRYCNREGRVGYEFGVRNYGPGDAKNVVVTFEELEFRVPNGWKSGCRGQYGMFSCRLGSLRVVPGENRWSPIEFIVFRSHTFRSTESRSHRLKITVSSDSEDPNPGNNTLYWTQTIPAFPENDGGCDWPWNN